METMGNVTQPTLQNLGTGLVISGAGHMDNTRHWPNPRVPCPDFKGLGRVHP